MLKHHLGNPPINPTNANFSTGFLVSLRNLEEFDVCFGTSMTHFGPTDLWTFLNNMFVSLALHSRPVLHLRKIQLQFMDCEDFFIGIFQCSEDFRVGVGELFKRENVPDLEKLTVVYSTRGQVQLNPIKEEYWALGAVFREVIDNHLFGVELEIGNPWRRANMTEWKEKCVEISRAVGRAQAV